MVRKSDDFQPRIQLRNVFNMNNFSSEKEDYYFIRLGLNGALTHQNMSYRDSETKENVESQKRKQRGGNDRKRTATTNNKHN